MSDLKKRVKQSAANRAAMMHRFGCIPLSVLRLSRGALSRQMFLYQQEKPVRSRSATKMMGDSERARERKAHGLIGGVLTPPTDSINATIMPAELVEFFIKYYAKPGDVYLDPFMGQGVQMQVAKLMGLDYYGYDCSEEFFAYIAAVKDKIDDEKTVIQITMGDSRYPTEIPDGIGDFSFHSPPYWDTEYYGDEPEQLGHKQSYEDFLVGMEEVARAWLPKFKSGAWHVVNVNDLRKSGKFYSYHADTIALFQRAGWVLVDTWIIDGLVGGLPKAFAVDFNLKRIAPKVHEYALVFRCP